ncbi:unnamed protein product [Oikopleura dioica]|uniref:Uncharacterized protein n=1 Tax=Oikopleura dioica TaxID=34765 RepID=E4XT49_OIKDI|nr:unnamed protein product [Oikopleura dioica]
MAAKREHKQDPDENSRDIRGWRKIIMQVEIHAECLKCEKIFQRVMGKSPNFLSQPCPHCYNNVPATIKNLRHRAKIEEEEIESDEDDLMPPPPPPLEIVELDYDSDDHDNTKKTTTLRKNVQN